MNELATPEAAPTSAPSRSTFVTVLAWISIALAGFASVISIMQALMFLLVFQSKGPVLNRGWPGQEQLPLFIQFVFEHPKLFFALFWSFSAVTLVAAIGLLRRKNWARLCFLVLLAFGCVWNLGGIWVQHQMVSVIATSMRHVPSDVATDFAIASNVISIGSAIFAVALAALFLWLIARLLSREVRAEFDAL